jgi:predicted Zn finger-like uncharacterized protein
VYTQCPECGTVFKVTPDVLRAARGVVRCGVCDATFNAVQSLSDQAATFKARAARQPAATAGSPLPAGLSELHAKVAALQADEAGAADVAITGRQRALRVEDIDAADDADLEFDAASTDWNTVFVDAHRAPSPPVDLDLGEAAGIAAPDYDLHDSPAPPREAAQRPPAAAYEQLFRSTAAAAAGVQSRAGRPLPVQPPGAEYEAVDPLAPAAAPPARRSGPSTAGKPTPDRLQGAGAASTPVMPATARPATPARTAEPDLGDDAGADDGLAAPPAADPPFEPADEEPAAPIRRLTPVEPLGITMPEPAPTRRYGWAVAMLCLVLALQVLHFEREAVAALPVVGPAVQRMYEAAGNPIEPHWSLADYDVRQLGSAGDVSGTLRVLARIQNRAVRAQPYPLLRVTILDRFETKIGRREFTPAEYLPSRRRPEGLLAPEQRVDADLLLEDPGTDAVSFELDLCLYERTRLVCSQDVRATP